MWGKSDLYSPMLDYMVAPADSASLFSKEKEEYATSGSTISTSNNTDITLE